MYPGQLIVTVDLVSQHYSSPVDPAGFRPEHLHQYFSLIRHPWERTCAYPNLMSSLKQGAPGHPASLSTNTAYLQLLPFLCLFFHQ